MKKTTESTKSSKKEEQANKREPSQKNARYRMMASPLGRAFYRHIRKHIKSGGVYMWWLEKGMYTLGHHDPNQFLCKRTMHGLSVQLGALKVAAKKKSTDVNHRKNVVSVFKRYVNWQKSVNAGEQLQVAA